MSQDEHKQDKKKSFDNLPKSEELSRRILDGLPTFSGNETRKWLINVTGETITSADNMEIPAGSDSARGELRLSSVALVDKLFDDFQRYCFEYNKSITDIDLKVYCQRPTEARTERDASNSVLSDINVLCQGHLSTRRWALMLYAERQAVYGSIVPVEYVVGFQAQTGEFANLFELRSFSEAGKQVWEIDGLSITLEMLPFISKKIFQSLVQVARGEAGEDEPLVLRNYQEPIPPELSPVMPKPVSPVELLTPDITGNDLAYNIPQPRVTPPVPGREALSAPNRDEPFSDSFPFLQPEELSADTLTVMQNLTHNHHVVAAACDALIRFIDGNDQFLSQTGLRAMQAQDMPGVIEVMKRSAALKELKQRLISFVDGWEKIESEST